MAGALGIDRGYILAAVIGGSIIYTAYDAGRASVGASDEPMAAVEPADTSTPAAGDAPTDAASPLSKQPNAIIAHMLRRNDSLVDDGATRADQAADEARDASDRALQSVWASDEAIARQQESIDAMNARMREQGDRLEEAKRESEDAKMEAMDAEARLDRTRSH